MKKILYLILVTIIVVFVACTPQAAPTATPTEEVEVEAITLSVSGSGSVTPILAAIADEFEAATQGYVLEVLPGSGTGGGVRGVIDGSLDAAAMSRPARDSEEGVEFVQFGTSVTAIMVHPDLGITELTSEQLTDIFTGVITNWSEVDGPEQEIILYVRDPEEGNTVDIREEFIGEDDFAESAQVMLSQTDMQNVVSSVEGAIGYGTWAAVIANGAGVSSVTIDGIGLDNAPESMTTIMGIGYLSERAGDIQPLADWLLSEDGQNTLVEVGVAPLASE